MELLLLLAPSRPLMNGYSRQPSNRNAPGFNWARHGVGWLLVYLALSACSAQGGTDPYEHHIMDAVGEWTALHQAVLIGDVDAIAQSQRGGSDESYARIDGIPGTFSPLEIAAFTSRDRCAQLLLSFGVNVEGKRSDGMTPLHLAASSEAGRFRPGGDGDDSPAFFQSPNRVISVLVKGGANLNALYTDSDWGLISSLDLACLMDCYPNAVLLHRLGAESSIISQVYLGDFEALRSRLVSLRRAGDLEEVLRADPYRSLMHLASERGDARCVALLMDFGWDPRLEIDGETPIIPALNGGNYLVLEALLSSGYPLTSLLPEGAELRSELADEDEAWLIEAIDDILTRRATE